MKLRSAALPFHSADRKRLGSIGYDRSKLNFMPRIIQSSIQELTVSEFSGK